MSARTRERVERAIADLDYRPNPAARNLRTGRTGMLALIVPEIDVPYFSALARHVIEAAELAGYRVMIDQTGHDHERERRLLSGAENSMLFDGVLFSPLVTQAELLEMTPSESMPFVLLGEHEFDGRFDHVAIDNVRAAHDAVSHLVAVGRTRIAAIGVQPRESYATPLQRTAGYRSTLEETGLAVSDAYMRPSSHYSRADGYAATAELLALRTPPDAILCFSDLLAFGAIRAVTDAGLSIPEDVAIIGIDDIEEGRYSTPSLSTVSLDIPFIAHEAVARIVQRLDRPGSPAREIVVPHQVVPRESTLGRVGAQA